MSVLLDLSQFQPEPLSVNQDALHFADANGVRLCYLDQGKGDPVLLIHGGGACIETWNHQLGFLAQQFRVIAPDCRGHGRSGDTEEPYSHALHAADMIALLDSLGITRAHVLGWSDGASFGLFMAMHYPQRVASLVMLGGMYSINHYSREAMDSIHSMQAQDYYPYLIELHQQLSGEPWENFFEKCRAMWATEPNHTLSDVRRVQADTLIILGENDEWGEPDQALEIKAAIPGCRLEIIPQANHAAHMTHASAVNALIGDFLNRP